MKSIRYEKFGEPARVLSLGESPQSQAGAGQLLVRTLCRSALAPRRGPVE
jgi:NADPH:quinone reductase-like Zn-dependent oxidoreductase